MVYELERVLRVFNGFLCSMSVTYIDESTRIADIAQPEIVIRGVDARLTVTEDLVQLEQMTGITKAEDIFGSLVCAITCLCLLGNL